MEIHIKKGLDALQTETVLRLLSQTVWACNRIISICIYYKANPAEPVNGQDERRICAAVDSPARLCRLTSFTAVLSLNCLLKCSIFSSILTLLSFASAEQ